MRFLWFNIIVTLLYSTIPPLAVYLNGLFVSAGFWFGHMMLLSMGFVLLDEDKVDSLRIPKVAIWSTFTCALVLLAFIVYILAKREGY